uniref:Uncharacterized protein n=1 Tax=Fagus sylvatica TaxID=28930 RepID=A0A2N9F4M6_FAGSY
MQGFSHFISSGDLVDPPLEGGSWSNSREEEAMSCIDRFLYTTEWEDQFPNIIQRRLPWLLSDNFPIILECGQIQWCSPRYVLANKLKALKADLKKWNVESFGNVAVKKTQFLIGLAELDNVAEGRPLTVDEKLEKERTVGELEKMILLEEIS